MRREHSSINAGSMADIAFLLLIFFLVTITLNVQKGLLIKLPKKNNEATTVKVNDRNILEVSINTNNELMVENKRVAIAELTQIAVNFIDNGAGRDLNGKTCDWCQGPKDPASSDHPSKAMISVQSSRNASYETYISVLDNLYAAYRILRDNYALKHYQISYTDLIREEKKGLQSNPISRKRILSIHEKYPLLISDSQIQN